MHTRRILNQFFDQHFGFLHAARARSYCDSVGAVLSGGMLSLCGLARELKAPTFKSATKRMDRLLGGAQIDAEAEQTSRRLLALLSAWLNPLVLAVDWSAVSPGSTFVELRAAVVMPGAGRGLVVMQEVLPLSMRVFEGLGLSALQRSVLALSVASAKASKWGVENGKRTLACGLTKPRPKPGAMNNAR